MIRVMLLDGSPLVGKTLSAELGGRADLLVVGVAADPYQARDMIVSRAPDVLVMDVDLPRFDGMIFLERLMRHRPMPVVVYSARARAGGEIARQARVLGASAVLCRIGGGEPPAAEIDELERLVKIATRIRKPRPDGESDGRNRSRARIRIRGAGESRKGSLRILKHESSPVTAVGASTGGTEALASMLSAMPCNAPPMLIVQHIPPAFVGALARRLDQVSEMSVGVACDGDRVEEGRALICPGNTHMHLRRSCGGFRVLLIDGPRVNRHRPSVDVLFRSVARAAGCDALGVLLTGMGRDGADGLREMREAGAHTIVQDEASSAVFGMPRAAILNEAADEVVPLDRIPQKILYAVMTMAH